MSDLLDFLNEMEEEASKFSSGFLGIIGEVIIEFGFHRWVPDKDFWTAWTPSKGKSDMAEARAKCAEILLANGVNEAPNFGIKTTVKANVLSRDQPYKSDLQEFIPAWQKGAYDLVMKHLEQAEQDNPGSVKIGEAFYAQIKGDPSPYHLAKGEAGKTEFNESTGEKHYPRIRVVKKAFKTKKEATEFMTGFEDDFVSVAEKDQAAANGFPYDKLSEKGKTTYKASENWDVLGQALHAEISDLIKAGDLGLKDIQLQVANDAGLEVADIKLFKLDLPF